MISRRTSFGRTIKKLSLKKQVENERAAKTAKNIGDKNTYFDSFLSDPEILTSFKMMSHIGKGCFSTVSLAIHKENN